MKYEIQDNFMDDELTDNLLVKITLDKGVIYSDPFEPHPDLKIITDNYICEVCDGEKWVLENDSIKINNYIPCPNCEGTGLVDPRV